MRKHIIIASWSLSVLIVVSIFILASRCLLGYSIVIYPREWHKYDVYAILIPCIVLIYIAISLRIKARSRMHKQRALLLHAALEIERRKLKDD